MSIVDRIMEQLLCPITHDLPIDPVVTVDGHVYERAAIAEHLRRRERHDPGCEIVLARANVEIRRFYGHRTPRA